MLLLITVRKLSSGTMKTIFGSRIWSRMAAVSVFLILFMVLVSALVYFLFNNNRRFFTLFLKNISAYHILGSLGLYLKTTLYRSDLEFVTGH